METRSLKRKTEGPEIKKPNLTGIPAQMKLDFEQRSGLSFDDVRVHYGSDRPARLGALAYTRGNEVYIGPGQERHLSHELGHVVQQKAGRVRPTGWIGGLPLNDQPELEREADLPPVQRMPAPGGQDVVQRQPDTDEDEDQDQGGAGQAAPAPAPPVPAPGPAAPVPGQAVPVPGPATLLPFGQNSAWYGSVHDRKVGSIYFGPGRIRLIHRHGPEISTVHDDGVTKKAFRYLIMTNNTHKLHRIQRILENHHRGHRDQAIGPGNKVWIERRRVYILSGRNALNQTSWRRHKGHLYEVFLTTPPARPAQPPQPIQYHGNHPSRGGIGALPAKWTDPGQGSAQNLMMLTYAVKLAQRITQQMASQFPLSGDAIARAQNFYNTFKAAETQRIPNAPAFIWQRIILNNILENFNGNMTQENMDSAGQAALAENPRNQAKRFGGYFGNQALRASGLINSLGFQVDPDD